MNKHHCEKLDKHIFARISIMDKPNLKDTKEDEDKAKKKSHLSHKSTIATTYTISMGKIKQK